MQKIKEMNQTISRLVDMTSNLAAREQVTTDKILYLQDTIMQHMEKQALEEGLDKKMMNEVQSHLADLSAELRSLKETSGKINSSPAKDKSGSEESGDDEGVSMELHDYLKSKLEKQQKHLVKRPAAVEVHKDYKHTRKQRQHHRIEGNSLETPISSRKTQCKRKEEGFVIPIDKYEVDSFMIEPIPF